jgi:UDP-N-acetylmuramoyl-tripeptide--D-alanyl-D-alanine ligase
MLLEGTREIRGGAVDSRRVEPGNAFFALPGERTDGHRFLDEAVARGATALVVRERPDEASFARYAAADVAVLMVNDPLVALQQAAARWRNRFEPLVVGVTGSLAKTSTKEQAAEVLAERWEVLRSTANENNEIGLPLTLLRMDASHEAAVLEMGMYVPGDIALLAALARPSIGVVTAVRGTHLARAGSIDEIERGKRQLAEALAVGGTAVLNADDDRVARMAEHVPAGVRVLLYGFSADAEVRATDVESRGAEGMSFTLCLPDGTDTDVAIPALGRHSVHNALAAAAVAFAAGLDATTIARGLARPFRMPHRTTLLDLGPIRVLDDSYNAAPDSMIAALDLLASLPGNRKIAILGEMLELGGASEAEHRRVGAYAGQLVDQLIATGPMATEYLNGARGGRAGLLELSGEDVEIALGSELKRGDTVLIKGSRGAAMDRLLPLLEQIAESMKPSVA